MTPSAQAALQALERLCCWNVASAAEVADQTLVRQFIEGAERDRVDAERYRAWRHDYVVGEGDISQMLLALSDAWSTDDVDSAIDAALAARSAEQKDTAAGHPGPASGDHPGPNSKG